MPAGRRRCVVAVPPAENYYPWERAPQWFEFGCFTLRSLTFWSPVVLAAAAHATGLYIIADWRSKLFDYYSLEQLLQSFAAAVGGPPLTWQKHHQTLGLGSVSLPVFLICAALTVLCGVAAAAVVAYRAKYEKPLAGHWIFALVLICTFAVAASGGVVALLAWNARELLRGHYLDCPSVTWPDATCDAYQSWAGSQEDRFFTLMAVGVGATTVFTTLLVLLSVVVGRAFFCAAFEYPDVELPASIDSRKRAVTRNPYATRTMQQQQQQPMPSIVGGDFYATCAPQILDRTGPNFDDRYGRRAPAMDRQLPSEVFEDNSATVTSFW